MKTWKQVITDGEKSVSFMEEMFSRGSASKEDLDLCKENLESLKAYAFKEKVLLEGTAPKKWWKEETFDTHISLTLHALKHARLECTETGRKEVDRAIEAVELLETILRGLKFSDIVSCQE